MSANLVILAAGLGNRLRPLTNITPKPLLKINGKPIIETIIEGFSHIVVDEIFVITGHLHEEFNYLEFKYKNLRILHNKYYRSTNNMYSLHQYMLLNKKKDVFICEGDVFFHPNFFIKQHPFRSVYYAVKNSSLIEEWGFSVEDKRIKSIKINNSNSHLMVGLSFINRSDFLKISLKVKRLINDDSNNDLFWDEAVNSMLRELIIEIVEIQDYSLIEIDTLDDLLKVRKLLVNK